MTTSKRYLALFCSFLLVLAAFGCTTEDDPAVPEYSTDPDDATLPGSTVAPLKNMDEKQVDLALKDARKEINKYRVIGITEMIDMLKAELKAAGIDDAVVAKINDSYMFDGKGTGAKFSTPPDPSSTTSGDYGQKTFALGKGNYKKHYDCPILAPEQTGNSPCDKMVNTVLAKVKTKIDQNKATVEATIKKTYSDMNAQAQNFIAAWAFAAQQYGASVAAKYAEHELKAAAKCDTKNNGMDISYHLGVEQGWKIVLEFRAWARSQVTSCVTNTDIIAQAVAVKAKARIDAYMKEHKTCASADISSLNEVFQKAETKRKSGIKVGIDQQVQVLRNELFQLRQSAPCPSSGGGGEPVVIDLDGDGLSLSTTRVKFDLLGDGTMQSTTWVGSNEGFLALDRDGNGLINSVRELMGNRSQCGDHLCYDGLEAMKALDSNKDNVLNAKDAVFTRLTVWVDANHDGVSQPGELSSLASRGITAVHLTHKEMNERNEGGLVTAQVKVDTTKGPRYAYDVWFNVQLRTENLAALSPR